MEASKLRLIALGWFRQEVDRIGRSVAIHRLDVSGTMVDMLRKGSREVTLEYIGRLAQGSAQETLLQLSTFATEMDHGLKAVEVDPSVVQPGLKNRERRRANANRRDQAALRQMTQPPRPAPAVPARPKPPRKRRHAETTDD